MKDEPMKAALERIGEPILIGGITSRSLYL